jgi:hypothetical protein
MIGAMLKEAAETSKPVSPKQRMLLSSLLHDVYPDNIIRQQVCRDRYDTSTWNKVSDEMVIVTLNWIKPTKDPDDKQYNTPITVYQELKRAAAPCQNVN